MCPAGHTKTHTDHKQQFVIKVKRENTGNSQSCAQPFTYPKIRKLPSLPFRISNCCFWK